MSFTKHHGKNTGLLSKIWIKLKSEVTDTKQPTDSLTITEGILSTGPWTQIEFIRGEASFQESASDDDHGDSYIFSVQIGVQKDRKEVSEALFSFMDRDLVCIVEDLNDKTRRLLGEVGLFGCRCRLTYSQDKQRDGSRNAYDLVIACQMHHPAYYYEGSLPT